MVFPIGGKRRITAEAAHADPIPDADQFPLDLVAMREMVGIDEVEQDDATLTKNLLGALGYVENGLRCDLIRSYYAAEYEVFPEVLGSQFIFTGWNGEVHLVTARTPDGGTVDMRGFETRPYGNNGAVAVTFYRNALPASCDGLEIQGIAGATRADLPEPLEQATREAFRYISDGQVHVKAAVDSLIGPYRIV